MPADNNAENEKPARSMSAPLLRHEPGRRARISYVRHGDSLSDETDAKFSNQAYNRSSDENPDITAMSVLSLYQSAENLDTEMDTEQDFVAEQPAKPRARPKIVIQESQQQKMTTVPNHSSLVDKPKCGCLTCPKPKNFFSDGERSVDFVMVWDAFDEHAIKEESNEKREIFEADLIKDGLELERELQEKNGLNFVKIHAPREVLRRYAEILKLRMPMRKIPALRQMHTRTNFLMEGITDQWDKLKTLIFVDKDKFPEKTTQRFTAIYSRDKEYLFDVDSPCFFTPAIHSRIVQFILDRKRFTRNHADDFAFGIERLLDEKVYTAVYPLHDGDLREEGTVRCLLYNEWAAIRKWYRYQPLDYIKEYFGVKIALYFAWLGFYTHMLIPAAIVGLICFIYSWSTLYSSQPRVSKNEALL